MGLFKSVIPAKAGIQIIFALTLFSLIPSPLKAATQCELQFDMAGRAKGEGKITCDNGQTSPVLVLTDNSWGTLFQKTQIKTAGHFSKAGDIAELFGRYVDFHGSDNAVSEAPNTITIWKRNISLAFSGQRDAWNSKAPLGAFQIVPKKEKGPSAPAAAGDNPSISQTAPLECKITFKIKVHAELLETGKGTGTITCDGGQTVPVIVTSAGSWIAVHKSRWIEGEGAFSKVDDLKKLFGGYTPTRIDQIQQGPSPPNVMWHKDISLTFGGKDENRLNYTRGRFKILPVSK